MPYKVERCYKEGAGQQCQIQHSKEKHCGTCVEFESSEIICDFTEVLKEVGKKDVKNTSPHFIF